MVEAKHRVRIQDNGDVRLSADLMRKHNLKPGDE